MKALLMVVVLGLTVAAAYGQPPEAEIPPGPPAAGREPGPPPPPPPGVDRVSDGELSELIQSVMAAKLSRELGLNEEQTVLMVRRFSEFREQLNGMKRQRQDKMKALRAALRDRLPDEHIETALQDLIAHDLKTLEMRKDAYQKAAGNLSTSQRAKLYVFISDFEGDMRRLIQKARAQRQGLTRPLRPMPPLGPPPPPDGPVRSPRLQRPPRPVAPPTGPIR
ncbi:MAG TPA: hypothetical protein VMZ06_13210 [Candidatus Bathyarchaeia archaeon]|nr:hypothetical protein [Candidatus Bathyarchaeia archaeon]